MREQRRNDAPKAPLQRLHPRNLLGQEQLQLGREVDHSPLAVLGLAGVQRERASALEAQLALLKSQYFGLHTPAEGVRDHHRNLQVVGEPTPDRPERLGLEEALPGRRLLEFAEHWHPGQPVVLVRQLEHPAEYRKLAVDAPVAGPLPLPVQRVGFAIARADRGEAATLEIAVKVRQAIAGLGDVAVARHRVVLFQCLRRVVVGHTGDIRKHRLSGVRTDETIVEDLARLARILRPSALVVRASALVILHPPHRAAQVEHPASGLRAGLRRACHHRLLWSVSLRWLSLIPASLPRAHARLRSGSRYGRLTDALGANVQSKQTAQICKSDLALSR